MRVTSDMVFRANARMMADVGRYRNAISDGRISDDGSIEVSAKYLGNRYVQVLTPKQIKDSFAKAISSYATKI